MGAAHATEILFEPSGKVMRPSTNDLQQADQDTVILGYLHGDMNDGRPYYAYVAIQPSKYSELHALTAARKSIVIGNYGTVIAAGFNSEPPPEIIQEMRDIYGFDEQYEAKLKQEAIRQRAVFLANREKAHIDKIVAMLQQKTTGCS